MSDQQQKKDPVNLHSTGPQNDPPEAPANPATSGKYMGIVLAAFVAIILVLYFTIGFGSDANTTLTGTIENDSAQVEEQASATEEEDADAGPTTATE